MFSVLSQHLANELLNSDDTCSQHAKVATLPSWRAHLSSVICAGRANTAPIVVSQVSILMKTKRQMPESDQIGGCAICHTEGGGVIGGKTRCEYLEVPNFISVMMISSDTFLIKHSKL